MYLDCSNSGIVFKIWECGMATQFFWMKFALPLCILSAWNKFRLNGVLQYYRRKIPIVEDAISFCHISQWLGRFPSNGLASNATRAVQKTTFSVEGDDFVRTGSPAWLGFYHAQAYNKTLSFYFTNCLWLNVEDKGRDGHESKLIHLWQKECVLDFIWTLLRGHVSFPIM